MNHNILQLRKELGCSKRWVIKIGSSLVTKNGLGLNGKLISDWASQISQLVSLEHQIVVVSSGAVAEGASNLGWKDRPVELNLLQAAAAVGQIGLSQVWFRSFLEYGVKVAQLLLTHDDFADRARYLNAKSTLITLLDFPVIPIINENDTVATSELTLGDNDKLAALVCNLIEADLLVVLTDQDGLMTDDPRKTSKMKLVRESDVHSAQLDTFAGREGSWGRGGMVTKIEAARLASRSATSTIIASGLKNNILLDISMGYEVGTLLFSDSEKITARKQWLGGLSSIKGSIVLDDGACVALLKRGGSILPVGIRNISGSFERGDLIEVLNTSSRKIATGFSNYSSKECEEIIGRPSSEIEGLLGFSREPEVVHRDNLVLA